MSYLAFIPCFFSLLTTIGGAAPANDLFKAHDFAGWEYVGTPAANIKTLCKILPDGVIAAAGSPIGYIATTASYKNYRLHAEWRWPDKAGNSGVLVHINTKPGDQSWPLSQQIQMKTKSVGDLMPMAGATFAEALEPSTKNPRRPHTAPDSEKPAGEWNVCDIICRDGTIEVTLNGVLQNKVTASKPAEGRVGFQFEGTPFELRHVRLERLD